jgi:uncharacterized membrane protein
MRRLLLVTCIVAILLIQVAAFVHADEEKPVVHAVLFYSPNCPHCHQVIQEVLPPLWEQHGEQLQIAGADTSTPDGSALYQAAIEHFQIPDERRGVPTLIIGDVVLVGSGEIPEQLPDLIEQGIAADGVGWPTIPNFAQPAPPTPEATATTAPTSAPTHAPDATPLPTPTTQPTPTPGLALSTDNPSSLGEIIARDMPGNAISIGVLCGMVLCLGYVVRDGVRICRKWKSRREQKSPEPEPTSAPSWQSWAMLALCLLGLGVASYLAYVETTLSEAVCGPVGDCNTVQQSEYARLFGLIPIAVLGVVGYIFILAVWAWGRLGRGRLAELTPVALLGLTLFGIGFSIYLTFLEPFVVGASCSWCLTSAVSMTLLLLLAARPGWETLGREWWGTCSPD